MRTTLCGLLVIAACLAQTGAPLPNSTTPPTAISVYYRLAGQNAGPYPYKWAPLDWPLVLTVDAAGSPHIGIDPVYMNTQRPVNAPTLSNNPKVALVTLSGAGQILLDTAFFAFRGTPPATSGPCTATAGVWASDQAFFYFCTQNATNDGLMWARIPLQTTW